MMKKNFNEEFSKVYEEPSLLTKFDVEEKAHVEIDPIYGDAILQAKKVRDKMKDDFKEQDKMVDEFIKEYDLEEKPELPNDLDNKDALKDMKLLEELSIDDLEEVEEEVKKNLEDEEHKDLIESLAYSYKDLDGVVGEAGEEITTRELYKFWEENKDYDPVVGQYKSFNAWMKDTVDNGYLVPMGPEDHYLEIAESDAESLEESVELNEDYSNFLGRPLKDFLKTLPRNTKINLSYSEPDDGSSGLYGRVSQIPWSVADRLIKDIQIGDENYYKFKILTESIEEDKKKDLTEARKASKFSNDDKDESYRYKVVAADEDDQELFIKDVKGIEKASKILNELTDEKLSELGATQVYIIREDDKEIYLKFSNDDGTWDIVQDDRESEKPFEDRDILFNNIMADLNAESTPDQKALRKLSREGEGYVGFEDDEIGFDPVEEVIHLKSQSDKPINWAKKVAEFYGFRTSEVSLGNNNYKHIDIFTPGLGK